MIIIILKVPYFVICTAWAFAWFVPYLLVLGYSLIFDNEASVNAVDRIEDIVMAPFDAVW